jgi:hypothetical protein
MVVTNFQGLYPDDVGRRQIFCGDGNGPASYTTGGDPVTLNNPRLYIDFLASGTLTNSGTYYVRAIKSAAGVRATWKYKWIVVSSGLEVTSATNLSAESLPVAGYSGTY